MPVPRCLQEPENRDGDEHRRHCDYVVGFRDHLADPTLFAESIGNRFPANTGLYPGYRFPGANRIEKADVPKTLRGLPITLVSASLVAVSFFAFKGLIENIFA